MLSDSPSYCLKALEVKIQVGSRICLLLYIWMMHMCTSKSIIHESLTPKYKVGVLSESYRRDIE
jgi:hypothetical protein